MRRAVKAALPAVMLGALGAGCSSPGPSIKDPRALLAAGKATVDATSALHFTLSSAGLPASGTVLTGGEGVAARPDRFAGTLKVKSGSFAVDVKVLSTGGQFFAILPLTTSYAKADPAMYGFGDPARLLDPARGVTGLLTGATSAQLAAPDRSGGEVLDEVDVVLPGQLVKELLTSADPGPPVRGRIGLTRGRHEVRRVVLTGPFLAAGVQTTFTVVLDRYGLPVSIPSAPAG